MSKVLSFSGIQRLQVIETVVVLFATMLIPFLVHLAPSINGNLSGMVFLPIFIAPLVAVFFFRIHVALIAGLLAPLMNYLILGRPGTEMVLLLSTEILVFVFLLNWAKNKSILRYIAAPLAFIIASFVAANLSSLLGFIPTSFSLWTNAIVVGFPGIIIMGLINWALVNAKK